MDSCCINSRYTFCLLPALCWCQCVCVRERQRECIKHVQSFIFWLAIVEGALKKNAAITQLPMCWFSTMLMYLSVLFLFSVCRAGFYKSTLGNMECSKCPPHSFSHHEGSLHCGCEKNYFRAEGDPASMACTRKCAFSPSVNSTYISWWPIT